MAAARREEHGARTTVEEGHVVARGNERCQVDDVTPGPAAFVRARTDLRRRVAERADRADVRPSRGIACLTGSACFEEVRGELEESARAFGHQEDRDVPLDAHGELRG